MKTKKEILNGIEDVIIGINHILSNPELLKCGDARVESQVKAFTRYCPFREYREILDNTLTYPFGSRKYDKKHLRIRIAFWLKLKEIIVEYEFQEKDRIKDVLTHTVREADILMFRKIN